MSLSYDSGSGTDIVGRWAQIGGLLSQQWQCNHENFTFRNFAVSNLRALSLLPNYLQHWGIHSPPIVGSRIYGFAGRTVDPGDRDELQLRATLRQLRLDRIISAFEFERTAPVKCLFCPKCFSGTCQVAIRGQRV
jgi:hypothetical protein